MACIEIIFEKYHFSQVPEHAQLLNVVDYVRTSASRSVAEECFQLATRFESGCETYTPAGETLNHGP
jgi:hypothetical protein